MSKNSKEAVEFFKDVFGVDGYVRLHDPRSFKRELNIGSIVELNDSKRGRFYVVLAEARDEKVVDQLLDKVKTVQSSNLNKAM